MRLRDRLSKLEGKRGDVTGGAWIVARDGQSSQDAIADYEAEHGPLNPDKINIIWTGVPRGDSKLCA